MINKFKSLAVFIIILGLGATFSGCTNNGGVDSTAQEDVEIQETVTMDEASPTQEPNLQGVESQNVITLEEVATHNKPEDCWLAINGKVYDVTDFIASGDHDPKIATGCGLDATKFFEGQKKHDKESVRDLQRTFEIGVLGE